MGFDALTVFTGGFGRVFAIRVLIAFFLFLDTLIVFTDGLLCIGTVFIFGAFRPCDTLSTFTLGLLCVCTISVCCALCFGDTAVALTDLVELTICIFLAAVIWGCLATLGGKVAMPLVATVAVRAAEDGEAFSFCSATFVGFALFVFGALSVIVVFVIVVTAWITTGEEE